MSGKVVICGVARSPIGVIGGSLAPLLPRFLGGQVAKAALKHAKCDVNNVEYMSVGWVLQDFRAPNLAQVISYDVGAPSTTPGTTLMENCSSGGAAIHDIARRILLGEISMGMAMGVESMSNTGRLLFSGRTENQMYGDMALVDGLMSGLIDPMVGPKGELMGLLTERLVEKYGLSREVQDQVAFNSHANAVKAWEQGMFDYVTPIEVKKKKDVITVSKDECPKKLEMSYFSALKPYFKKEGGTITGATSSVISDGAAALVLASEERAKQLGLPILAHLAGYGNVGVPRELMGEGAFKVIPALLKRAKMEMKDIDYFEINEAFAAVVAGAAKDIPELSLDRVNQWGSGISLGHPVGATGCRQVVDMVMQLHKRNKSVGLTTRCVGGGMGSGEVVVRC